MAAIQPAGTDDSGHRADQPVTTAVTPAVTSAVTSAWRQPPTQLPDPQTIAEAVRDALWARDRASQALGMCITSIGPAEATLTMTVRGDMLNGHGSCHGGLITTLADSAFAFACNACNEMTVASGITVNLVAPAQQGDVLTARCTEQHRSGRNGVYDCEVHNQRGERVALFRGHSTAIKGRPVVEGLPLPGPRLRSHADPSGR